MRHAILILGHGSYNIIEKCLEVLDSNNIDFYIHVNKLSKTDPSYLEHITKKSKVVLIERMEMYWGSYRMSECELKLLATAAQVGYDYYHFISGQDLPLVTPKELDTFFTQNAGKEFVRKYFRGELHEKNLWRIKYRYPLIPLFHKTNNKILNGIQKLLFMRLIRAPRKKKLETFQEQIPLFLCDPWWSITSNLANYILENKKFITEYFLEDSFAPDELYMLSMLMHNPELARYQTDENTRYLDWKRGHPYVWRIEDYEELSRAKAIFARKFDVNQSAELIEMLVNDLMSRKQKQDAIA